MRMAAFSTATLFAVAALWMQSVSAETRIGDLVIEQVWVRATIPGRPGAAYFVVRNTGARGDRITAVSSPAAGRAVLHHQTITEGVVRMRPADHIDVPGGATVMLDPGGSHVMLFDLDMTAVHRGKVPLTITFEQAGAIDVEAVIQPLAGGAGAPRPGPGDPPGHGH